MSEMDWATAIGVAAGGGGVLILAVVAVYLAFRPSARRFANKHCIRSLALALAGWGIPLLVIPLMLFPESAVGRVTATVILVVAMLVQTAAIAVALLGLYASIQQGATLRGGKKRASAALVLSVLFLVYAGPKTCVLVWEKLQSAPDELRSLSLPRAASFPERNFRIETMPRPWRRLPKDRLYERSVIGFENRYLQSFFVVYADPVGFGPSRTTAIVHEEMKQAVLSEQPAPVSISESPHVIDGIDGMALKFQKSDKEKLSQVYLWMAVYNGLLYAIHIYMDMPATNLDQELETISARFKIIDHERLAEPLAPKSITDFHSEDYGFDVAIAGSQWKLEETSVLDPPAAQFSAENKWLEAGMEVQVFYLNGHDPSFSDITAAFLRMLGSSHPPPQYSEIHPPHNDGLGARFVQELIDQGKPCGFGVTVWKKGDRVFLCSVRVWKNGQRSKEVVEETLKRFSVSSGEVERKSPDELSDYHRSLHAFFFASLGKAKSAGMRHREALDMFLEAQRYTPLDATIALGIASLHLEMGAHEAALTCLDEHIAEAGSSGLTAFPQDETTIQLIHSLRAVTLATLGRTKEALGAYHKLFSEGYRDPELLLPYAQLLESEERIEEAVSVLEDLLEESLPAPDAVVYLVALYGELGREAEALALLEAEVRKPNTALGVWCTLTEIHLDAEDYASCFAVCTRMIWEHEDSGYAHYLKGEAEAGLKRYGEAKKSFKRAIEREPEEIEYRLRHDDMVKLIEEREAATLRS